MRNFLVGAVCALFALLQPLHAQTSAGAFSRLPTGTEYRLFRKDAAGRYQPRALAPTDAPYASRAGQLLMVFMEFRTGRDSVVMNSRQMQPTPQPVPLPASPTPGGLEEALGLLLPGDSAVFRFQADSIFAKTFLQPVPPFLRKSGNALVVIASARELLSVAEMTARQEKIKAEYAEQAQRKAIAQTVRDNAQIDAYLKKNKLVAKKTAGGTYYIVTRPGKGLPPKKGQTVRVLYRGSVLATGKEFDSSAKHGNEPIAFPLGTGQVIRGWDQGIAMLSAGSKAVLLIPSALAYGPRGAGADIPADAVLRFEVELVDVK
ncbi:FKBP-type peptidyl-prolyl cis-trans isomerase [Hymenobacter sp. BT683]|uniref:Peptidyl-prolyl cis-trans isomerase n=1 Tax=Hymenobacter jeongseonensis TaxID=2791027 RepID=A0ABS0IFI2_9BACT|nr:FKBP-type peptidyl-prolyl cis-trans isomerase [Hymenobacter jeongseonensis]MBF9237118.1 FKBP-type peptidyl-prolyl cis-trans isomerase [Hymenobacter jeongseonensis]